MDCIEPKTISCFIKKSIDETFKDILSFCSDPRDLIQAEYLFTVNTAKMLSISKLSGGEPYRIIMEKRTNLLINECFPSSKTEKIEKNKAFSRTRIISTVITNKSNIRKGKIDIVIYRYDDDLYHNQRDYLPICAIELKAFNPSSDNVKKDLKRNLAFLNLSANIGVNSLTFTAFSSFEWFKSIKIDDDCEHLSKVREKYENIIDYVLDKRKSISYNLEVFTIKKSHGDITRNFEMINGYIEDLSEIDTSTKHHFVGVIITFEKISF